MPDEIPAPPEPSGVTEDAVLNGRVRLRQPVAGYRAGMDAALLAAACDADPGERVIEAGCGVGGALLAAASRRPEARFVGLERDPAAADLARGNVALNEMTDRVEIVGGEVERGFRALDLPVFDAAISNPPFFDDPAALRAPSPRNPAPGWPTAGWRPGRRSA